MIKERHLAARTALRRPRGDGFGQRLRRLTLATRSEVPDGLGAAVIVGTAGAPRCPQRRLHGRPARLLATALVQAASNVINDVGDEVSGSDPPTTTHLSIHRRLALHPEPDHDGPGDESLGYVLLASPPCWVSRSRS